MNISLRKATIDDSPLIQKWWQDGKVMAAVGFPQGLAVSIEEVQQSLHYYEEISGEFLLIIDEKGHPIGEFAYKPIEAKGATFDIKIGELSRQRQGYGKAALEKGMQRIAAQNRFNRIEITVNSTNEPALKLYEKVGFKQSGFLKDHWVNQVGERCSTVVMVYELADVDNGLNKSN